MNLSGASTSTSPTPSARTPHATIQIHANSRSNNDAMNATMRTATITQRAQRHHTARPYKLADSKFEPGDVFAIAELRTPTRRQGVDQAEAEAVLRSASRFASSDRCGII